MRVPAFHSDEEDIEVYHICANCGPGSLIKDKNEVSGTGGYNLCDVCERLTKNGTC